MKWSQGLPQILGKRIESAVVRESGDPSSPPQVQLFLIFDDNTYLEFYSADEFTCAAGVDTGGLDEVRQYMPRNKITFECGKGTERQ